MKDYQLIIAMEKLYSKEDKAFFKKSNRKARLKKNKKRKTVSKQEEIDVIYRSLVKGKEKIDGIPHGIQIDEFRLALLRISRLAPKVF